jgi:hypothetical protein
VKKCVHCGLRFDESGKHKEWCMCSPTQWRLSERARKEIEEIEQNIRYAAMNAKNLISD